MLRIFGPSLCQNPSVLLPPLLRDLLFYSGFVVGILGLVGVAIGGTATLQKKRQKLPEATLVSRPPRNGVLWQLVGGFALIGGPAASIWIWFHSNGVVFVRDDPGNPRTPRIERQTWVGETYRGPRSLARYPNERTTWIVNQSSHELTAASIGYGDAKTYEAIIIPPGASLPVESVDYVGPDDSPPNWIEVKVPKPENNMTPSVSASRVWLTWP